MVLNFPNREAPINAAIIAGKPNIRAVLYSIFFQTNVILKRLLRRWTTAVKAIATSIGKNKAKTGIKIVPNPKPEKKVSSAAPRDTIAIKISSILAF